MEYSLNLLSIVLGIVALLLPGVAVMMHKKNRYGLGNVLTQLSFLSALTSLLSVIAYQNYLVTIEDWSAIMDTSHAFMVVSCLFVAAVCAVNALSFGVVAHLHAKNKGE